MRWTAAIIWALNVVLAIAVAGLWWRQLHQPVEPLASDGVPYDTQQMLAQLRTYKMYHGNPARKWIALAFDDGPHPYHTPVLLKTLRRLHVRATFFVVGRNVHLYPDTSEYLTRCRCFPSLSRKCVGEATSS